MLYPKDIATPAVADSKYPIQSSLESSPVEGSCVVTSVVLSFNT